MCVCVRACACVRARACVCVCVYALRIVSMDMILGIILFIIIVFTLVFVCLSVSFFLSLFLLFVCLFICFCCFLGGDFFYRLSRLKTILSHDTVAMLSIFCSRNWSEKAGHFYAAASVQVRFVSLLAS